MSQAKNKGRKVGRNLKKPSNQRYRVTNRRLHHKARHILSQIRHRHGRVPDIWLTGERGGVLLGEAKNVGQKL